MRIRVNALIYNNDSILLIKHTKLGPKGELWLPPGGGLEFGETTEEALFRETYEETGLRVKNAEFQFINEYIAPPLHAIELFFNVKNYEGTLTKGFDPEMGSQQIIDTVKFVTFNELRIMDDQIKHNILRGSTSKDSLKKLSGTIEFKSNR